MERDFKGIWIDKKIWLNKDLTVMEKLFLVEIDSLDNERGCFASNAHFSELFGVSKGRCTQIIKSLESKKLISITIHREGKVISRRVIRILNRVVNKLNTPIKKTKYPYLENDEGINTLVNNTKERESRAHLFLKSNYSSRWESFVMQNKKQILEWEKFLQDFDDTVDVEGLSFSDKILFGRINKYARNWIANSNRNTGRVVTLANAPQFKRLG